MQEREYEFDGSFSWAFVNLAKRGADDVILNSVEESDPDGWRPVAGLEVDDSPKSLYLRWGYSAQDERRTFRLDYLVKGAVRRYSDCAEFYWKVIEDEHERVGEVAVSLVLPEESPELFKVFVHSAAAPGRLWFDPKFSRAEFVQTNVPKNTFVEMRAVMQAGIFPATPARPEPGYERILAEERRNFVWATVRKLVLIPLGLVLAVVVPVILLVAFYFRYGREPKIQYEAIYEHEPPRSAPPVAIHAVLHQKPDTTTVEQSVFRGMLAIMLDLCRRRIVSVREVKARKKYEFVLEKPEEVERLDSFSRTVATFFFGQVAGGGSTVSDEMVKDYTKKNLTRVKELLGRLDEMANEWWRKELGTDFLDPMSVAAHQRAMVIVLGLLVLGSVCLGLGLGVFARGGGPWIAAAVFGVVAGVVLSIGARPILRWSETAYLEHRRWRSFRRFLIEFSAIEQAPVELLAIWEQYYVYAVALGVADRFLKNVARLAEAKAAPLVVPAWYVASTGTAGMASLADSLAGFQSFASNMSSMAGALSSSSGTGGGFSGGGGGGGGGGSSGAG